MASTKRGWEAADGERGEGDDARALCSEEAPPRKRTRRHSPGRRSPAGRPGPPASALSHGSSSRQAAAGTGTDHLSPLSDELLLRILGYLSLPSLLALAPVSRRFHRLADDSQLWKAIYYDRFVLPRALRIPGFSGGSLTSSARSVADRSELLRPLRRGHVPNWKQQYKLRHNWARGQCAVEELRLSSSGLDDAGGRGSAGGGGGGGGGGGEDGESGENDNDGRGSAARMLVKVVDGIAVTADRRRGLRVWELKSRSLIASQSLSRPRRPGQTTENDDVRGGSGSSSRDSESNDEEHDEHDEHRAPPVPTSLAVDPTAHGMDIAIGLLDGGFDVWQLDLVRKTLTRRFSHPASSSGPLTGIAYAHPYVLTATDAVLISLYAFETVGAKPGPRLGAALSKPPRPGRLGRHPGPAVAAAAAAAAAALSPPRLLTSLRSHTSRPPLALSIRKLASVTVASIAYTFATRQGWSIGIQDLHVQVRSSGPSEGAGEGGAADPAAAPGAPGRPVVVATRLAFTMPVRSRTGGPSRPLSARRRNPPFRPLDDSSDSRGGDEMEGDADSDSNDNVDHADHADHDDSDSEGERIQGGPTTLCYSHPYLLATMPDNTLILHLCTSNASTLALSAGIRLWGHTSGISDAEITARGKAVSVSMRGEEMRVWELEGRPAAERGRSVAIQPSAGAAAAAAADGHGGDDAADAAAYDWDERRNWVGFDDEMVIVLKEARGGRESLMVYDFT